MKNTAFTKAPLKEKVVSFFKDKFNLFALITLTMSIVLFIVMIVLVSPKVGGAIQHLKDIAAEQENIIYGYQVVEGISPMFYLLMFSLHIIFSLTGIYQLIKYRDQRKVFKVIFKSIYYVGGLLFVRNLIVILFWLILPITEILGLLGLISVFLTLEIALAGRLVSNFSIYNASLAKRKKLGVITATIFIIYCIWSLTGLYGDFDTVFLIFYLIELVSGIFALLACLFFNDPILLNFEKEPKINRKPENIKDLPSNLTKIVDRAFAKNTKLDKATIPDNISTIGISAFANALRLKEVIIPKSIKEIGNNAFFNCTSLGKIIYLGTKEEFSQIKLNDNWLKQAKTCLVTCSDGVLVFDN